MFFGVLGFIDRFLLHVTWHDSIVNCAQKPGKKCRRGHLTNQTTVCKREEIPRRTNRLDQSGHGGRIIVIFVDDSLKFVLRHFCGYFCWDLNSHHFHSDKWINSSTLRSRSSYYIPILDQGYIIFCRVIPLLKVGPDFTPPIYCKSLVVPVSNISYFHLWWYDPTELSHIFLKRVETQPPTTPLKINMEHNQGGLEDHFPF